MFFQCLVIFRSGVFVVGLQLADLFEILDGKVEFVKCKIRTTESIVGFKVGWVTLDGVSCIEKSESIVFSFDADLGSVAVQNGLEFWGNV